MLPDYIYILTMPPVRSLPIQRILDRLDEIEAELGTTSGAMANSLDDALARFQLEMSLHLRALDCPGWPARPRSVKALLPVVMSTAVLTALITTAVALLIQG